MKANKYMNDIHGDIEREFFEDGFDKAIQEVKKEFDNLLNVSKYTDSAELVRTLIRQSKYIVTGEEND